MRRNKLIPGLFLFLMSIVFVSCGNDNGKQETVDNEDKTPVVTNNDINRTDRTHFFVINKDYSFDEKDDYKNQLNKGITDIDNEINKLQGEAEKVKGDTKKRYHELISDLKDKKEILKEQSAKVDDQTKESWVRFKSNVNNTWNELENDWDKMMTDIKRE